MLGEDWLRVVTTHKNPTICDIESDGLLDEATKLHVVGFKMHGRGINFLHGTKQIDRIKDFLNYHIENKVPIVFHNGICFDIPLLEKLLEVDLKELIVIDTLPMSWYLNVDRKIHGLDSFFNDYGIAKPEISDWENLSYEEYCHRVEEDVKITEALYNDLIGRLYDMYSTAKPHIDSGEVGSLREYQGEEQYIDKLVGISVEENINRILSFLMSKEEVRRVQEETGWHVDEEFLDKKIAEVGAIVKESAKTLEAVMPPVAVYSERKEPKNKYKKDGSLSAHGERWEETLELLKTGKKDDYGNLLAEPHPTKQGVVRVIRRYDPPNIASSAQVKRFLYSKGWKPLTFNYVRDKEAFDAWIQSKPKRGASHFEWQQWKDSRPEDRAVEQVRVDGELCESVVELAEKVPEIAVLEEYSVVKHRWDTMKGIKERVNGGKIQASWSSTTNTMRVKHRAPAVNLPSVSRKYAEGIRGSFIAPDGYISIGSDLSGLESRIGNHFKLALDRKSVEKTLEEGYDPHMAMALQAGLVTEEDVENRKNGITTPEVESSRAAGKSTNYASEYGAMPPTIAEAAGVSLEVATKLWEAYWELNWTVKEIAKRQTIITDNLGLEWLVNPINGLLYNVRSEKDIWNTLVQGTGSFMFDMWIFKIHKEQRRRWGKSTQTASFHDEGVWVVRDNPKAREVFTKIIRESVKSLGDEFKLRVDLDCDVQYGKRYSEIH